MQTTTQIFPSLTIEPLPNGLFRLEDPTFSDGAAVDVHPVHAQALASMVGFVIPDKSKRAIGRIHERIKALSEQASELEGLLDHAFRVQDVDVLPEWKACQFIALNLAQVVKDLEDLTGPDFEPVPDATANAGGQLTIPM